MTHDIENTTKELLKKSMLTLPDENFSDRVMERIHQEALEKKPILSSISKAWIFTILSLVFIPFVLSAYASYFQTIIILNLSNLVIDPTSLSIISSSFFAVVILLILNSLIRLTLSRKPNSNY